MTFLSPTADAIEIDIADPVKPPQPAPQRRNAG